MDLKRLLNLKNIDFDKIQQVLNNRKELLQGKEDFLDADYFRRLVSTEIPIINYYSGDVEAIKRLIPFCNKNNVVLFPSDIIEVTEKFNRITKYRSDTFFTHIMDSLAQNDGYAVPETNEALTIYNIKSIKIVSESPHEISEHIKNIENFNVDKESLLIEEQLISIINNVNSSFGEPFYKNLNHLMSNVFIRDFNENDILKVESLLKEYIKKGDILSLIYCIQFISKKCD